tara:strand:- start:45 stop:506 length:462 start_codon:yes stop_codon:yes gene_type:complete
MSFYETLYIVDPNLENNALEKIMDEIGKELVKTKSKIINHRIWGKKRLAYPIDRQKYGSYIILQFEGGGNQDKMNEYDIWMRLNNSILRHITVLLKQKPELYVEDNNAGTKESEESTNQDVSDNKEVQTSDSKSEKEKDSNTKEENIKSKEDE